VKKKKKSKSYSVSKWNEHFSITVKALKFWVHNPQMLVQQFCIFHLKHYQSLKFIYGNIEFKKMKLSGSVNTTFWLWLLRNYNASVISAVIKNQKWVSHYKFTTMLTYKFHNSTDNNQTSHAYAHLQQFNQYNKKPQKPNSRAYQKKRDIGLFWVLWNLK